MYFYFTFLMLLVDVIMFLFFLYSVFCKKSFQLNEKILVIKTKVLYYKTTKLFTRKTITQVKQVKDGGATLLLLKQQRNAHLPKGGEGKDSFPSWGLNMMYGNRKVTIILRQPHVKSLWLGEIISSWANVPFETVPSQ